MKPVVPIKSSLAERRSVGRWCSSGDDFKVLLRSSPSIYWSRICRASLDRGYNILADANREIVIIYTVTDLGRDIDRRLNRHHLHHRYLARFLERNCINAVVIVSSHPSSLT
jgi:hypothetical protein